MKPEQDHIVAAITFELSKVETPAVVARVLGQLANIGEGLAERVAAGLGWGKPVAPVMPAVPVRKDLPPSPMLSILAKAVPTLEGRTVGALVSDGVDNGTLAALRQAVAGADGVLKVVALKVGGVTGSDGAPVKADMQLAGASSVLFDAVALMVAEAGSDTLLRDAAAVDFARNAYAHCKVIGHTAGAAKLLVRAGVDGGWRPRGLGARRCRGVRGSGQAGPGLGSGSKDPPNLLADASRRPPRCRIAWRPACNEIVSNVRNQRCAYHHCRPATSPPNCGHSMRTCELLSRTISRGSSRNGLTARSLARSMLCCTPRPGSRRPGNTSRL